MSVIAKIKQFLGVGTVSIKLISSPYINLSSGVISGSMLITGKSDQEIKMLDIEVEEEWTKKTGEEEETKTILMGKIELPGFQIKKNETRKVDFTVKFTYEKTEADKLADKRGIIGKLGKFTKAASEKSEFILRATADVKGAKFDPEHSLKLQKVQNN